MAADLVAEQVARGWRAAVACPPESLLVGWIAALEVEMHPWPATRTPGLSVPDETRRLAAIVGSVTPDVVHLHSAKAGLAGRLAVRGARATVFQPHAWSFDVQGRAARPALLWERVALRWTDAVLCVSESERRRATSAGLRGRLEVVGNGVDVVAWPARSRADRAAARADLGLDAEAPLAVCLGRLSPQKNQGALLDAWPEVRGQVPGAALVLVGDGDDRAALEAREVGGVTFAGQRDDVGAWLAAADLVVQPSRYEGLSLALLEAMASARSVVATDVGGMREALEPAAGAVVPVGDREALVAAIGARLGDRELADREGAAGRARVELRYDVAAVGGVVMAAYDSVLAGRER